MNCIVCMTSVPDTASVIKVGGDGKGIDGSGIKWIVSPYDEYALEEALQSLAANETLTADQVDAVVETLGTARELRSHPHRRGMRVGWELAEMLEDGVIDGTELAELPDGHPLADPEGPAAGYLDDGQLTEDELAELRSQHRLRRATTEG